MEPIDFELVISDEVEQFRHQESKLFDYPFASRRTVISGLVPLSLNDINLNSEYSTGYSFEVFQLNYRKSETCLQALGYPEEEGSNKFDDMKANCDEASYIEKLSYESQENKKLAYDELYDAGFFEGKVAFELRYGLALTK